MAKIVLIDPIYTGHHKSYARTLAQGLRNNGHIIYAIGDPEWLTAIEEYAHKTIALQMDAVVAKTLSGEKAKFNFLKRSLHLANSVSPDIIHFLYLDHFIVTALAVMPLKNNKVRGTLHWGYLLSGFSITPFQRLKSWIERACLRTLVKAGMRVMVHSPTLREQLELEIKQSSIDFVPYPVEPMPRDDIDAATARRLLANQLNLAEHEKLLLLFGDLRSDKGAEYAIAALALLPNYYHLLIAGKGTTSELCQLREAIYKLGLAGRIHLHSHFIPDKEVPIYFKGSDTVLIPYRRNFAGQSGPLTIAATMGVPVVAADLLVLRETVTRYRLGHTFIAESPADLARAILAAENSEKTSSIHEFIEDHGATAFTDTVEASYFGKRLYDLGNGTATDSNRPTTA